MSQEILTKINEALGNQYFREIRFSENLWRSTVGKMRPADGVLAHDFKKRLLVSRGPRSGRRNAPDRKDLYAALQSFKEAMEERKRSLLAMGFIACRECGCLYPTTKKGCPFCKTRREFSGYNCVIAILEEHPEIPMMKCVECAG